MRHLIRLPGRDAQEVVIESGPLQVPEVFVVDQRIERARDGGRSYWPIPRPDGGERRLYLRNSLRGLQAAVDGVVIPVERRLAAWELVIALWPLALIVLGIPGGIVGFVGAVVSFRIARLPWPAPVRAAASLGVLGASLLCALTFVRLLFGG